MDMHNWNLDDNYPYGDLIGPGCGQVEESLGMSQNELLIRAPEQAASTRPIHIHSTDGRGTKWNQLNREENTYREAAIVDGNLIFCKLESQNTGIMDQGVGNLQPNTSPASDATATERLQSNAKILPLRKNLDGMQSKMSTSPFTCDWDGCFNKSFTKKSDLRKHLDRHTKPYACQEKGCNGLAFGDNASLHRHEAEKHGKHDAKTYLCSVVSCPRARKGFPRKKNRDLHISTRHNASFTMFDKPTEEGSISANLEQADGGVDVRFGGEHTEIVTTMDIAGLELKLKELVKEKSDLDLRRSRVDEDIKALKRAIQLVAG